MYSTILNLLMALVLAAGIYSCEPMPSYSYSQEPAVDYLDTLVLDSLILVAASPVGDTMVFNIVYGSKNKEYRGTLKNLMDQGIEIQKRQSFTYPGLIPFTLGKGDLISLKHQGKDRDEVTIYGKGAYYLVSEFTSDDSLKGLAVMVAEKWDDSVVFASRLNWFEEKALKGFSKVEDTNLRRAIRSIDGYSMADGIWEKGNLIVVKNGEIYFIKSRGELLSEISMGIKNNLAESSRSDLLLGEKAPAAKPVPVEVDIYMGDVPDDPGQVTEYK